jgi:hypothetical protein
MTRHIDTNASEDPSLFGTASLVEPTTISSDFGIGREV